MKKNKMFKKAMSLLLSFAILVGTFSICLPFLKIDAGAITTSDGTNETVTQTQIVTTDRESTYSSYAAQYLNGAGESTGIVIPGLATSEDYVIQGMTYYPQKDWMLVTAYHNDATYSSKVFCLDAATGEFVAMLSFLNVDGTTNMDHGGGIAISEYNLYYSCGDQDRKIAYAPLSALDGITTGEHRVVQLAGEAVFYEVGSVTSDSKTAYSAYVCYDQGYLWMGNFYDRGAFLGGVAIAATDYNTPATSNYNSMVYGYKLKGSNSSEEWTNLVSGTSDCKGTPTHAIALDNNIKDVQYAVVDDGKLYLSCSFGSGAGNSVSFGFGATSRLITADIDLSATPATDIVISLSEDNSTTKTIKAHKITEYKTFEMMPMSEGLCIINDLIFCTFESASNKYLNESSGITSIGNCEKPVDVIWKIDPYALENEVKVIDTPSTHYEKVNSLSEIVDGEEYLIVYESSEKDPVTQKNILYAIDANGGYNDYRLSKNTYGSGYGYVGAIGHPITEYDMEGNNLYLGNATEDDAVNVRWEINSLGNGAYSIQSPDYYFVNHPNFYFDASTISMATDTVRGTNMMIQESTSGDGGFWICNNGNYLWCNDGTTESYNTAYNNYYTNSTVPMYSGLTEEAGTFHTDALNASGSNILGGAIVTGPELNYAHGIFYIYKRVVDKTASTYESRVYTDMKAALQSDGTYTIDLETYAISPNHYQYVGDRPTDYIIVMDKSQSVASTSTTDCNNEEVVTTGTVDGTALREWASTDSINVSELCETEDSKTPASGEVGVNGYAFSDPDNQVYFKHTDGKYYRVYIAINTLSLNSFNNPNSQYYWAYYVADDGLYYVLQSAGESSTGASYVHDPITRDQFISNVDNAVNRSGMSSSTSNDTRREAALYTGVHYTYTCGVCDLNATTRIETIKAKAVDLVSEISAQGTDNRIAVTYYGEATTYLNTAGTWATSGFTDALWEANSTNAETLKTQINNISNISNTAQTDNTGMELAGAESIMSNSGVTYTADGTRNCIIIFMSDGVPGADDNSDTTTAANAVIAKSLDAKNNGAFIYTALVGEDTSFDTRTYMDAVSSKYPAAANMNNLGGSNVDGVEYVKNLSDITLENFMDFAPNFADEFAKNEAVGLANLDVNSILYEELSAAFKPIINEDGTLKDGVTITHTLVPGSFDKVERFTFDESKATTDSNITVGYDESNTRLVTVKGYDYGEQYISTGKTGYKLRITITGVLADEEADITNTSINNTSTTAIYQTNDSTDVFKYFPTSYFNIPTYTYVLDYDMAMYDSDVNGTLLSVDGGLNKQDVNNYNVSRETDNVALKFANNNLDMTYELVSGEYTDTENRSFCLIQRDDGTYDWFRINIVPASNVLFEEGRFAATTNGSLSKSNWALQGTALNTQQTLSGDNDRYGYDEVYANNGAGYSNGTAYKATVNSTTKRSETMAFTYTGTGFDLMAACGPNTGIQLVNIKNSAGEIEKLFMVDTYYVDADNYAGDDDILTQVPIINYTNAGGYGTYTVEVTAAYLSTAQGVTGARSSLANRLRGAYSVQDLLDDMDIDVPASEVEKIWFNDNSILNGGRGPVATASGTRDTTTTNVSLDCYIDGIRVYNPLGDNTSLYINSEKGATYHNVVGELASGEGDVITSDTGLFAYVVGELEADSEGNVPTLTFANYQSVGPQHELYLQTATGSEGSHAVAFNVTVPNSDSRVMISLRAVDGATKAKVASGTKAIEFEINTATEQYFDITPYLDIDTTTGKANVIITNTGSGLLGINNLKLVDATAAVVESGDLSVMAMSLSVVPEAVDPNSYDYDAIVTDDDAQQPETDEPTEDNNDVEDGNDVEVPVVVENIFTKIIAFIKKLFASILNIF